MNTVEFALEVKQELGNLGVDNIEAISDIGKQKELVLEAVTAVKSRHSVEELSAMVDSNRELAPEELETIAGGSALGVIADLAIDTLLLIL